MCQLPTFRGALLWSQLALAISDVGGMVGEEVAMVSAATRTRTRQLVGGPGPDSPRICALKRVAIIERDYRHTGDGDGTLRQ